MKHFAEIDDNNIVLRILVIDDSLEHRGQDYLANEMGFGGRWIQTDVEQNFRGIYAFVGCTYDPVQDVFVSPFVKNPIYDENPTPTAID
jgi:hypothetical protein